MARLDRAGALDIANSFHIPLGRDFHALNSDDVESVLAAADAANYRKPRNANGSRARYFHAYLVRAARRSEA